MGDFLVAENSFYKHRADCRCCRSTVLTAVVRLPGMPIATPNFRVLDETRMSQLYREAVPLDLYLCADCGLLQISDVGNPVIQYREYVYRTTKSLGLSEHFTSYAREISESLNLRSDAFVAEIGSNDGTLLRAFQQRGMRVLGVDPAKNIAHDATKSGIETLPEFFDEAIGRKIQNKYGTADVVIANNVFANIDDIEGFVRGIAKVLGPDGIFVCETQYGKDVIEKLLLDTIYHEHLSYFNIQPLAILFDRCGLELIGVKLIATKGGSIRVTAQHRGAERPKGSEVAAMIAKEIADGFLAPARYIVFQSAVADLVRQLTEILDDLAPAGAKVAGYGASVGTLALLAQLGLMDRISYLVDDDSDKEAVISGPGYDLPVRTREYLAKDQPPAVVVFAWRYIDSILKNNSDYVAAGGRFVVPLPSVLVVPNN